MFGPEKTDRLYSNKLSYDWPEEFDVVHAK